MRSCSEILEEGRVDCMVNSFGTLQARGFLRFWINLEDLNFISLNFFKVFDCELSDNLKLSPCFIIEILR